jgi:hypothetical protein
VILDFNVEPSTVTAGQNVTITWQVSGADEVSIQPIGDHLPAAGLVNHVPAETSLYVLAASNGQQSTHALRQITVIPAPPTPVPTSLPSAPTIQLFSVSPAEPVQLSDEEVQIRLNWVVSGKTTDIILTGGPLGQNGYTQLAQEDSLTINIAEDSVFVLKALNGDQQAVRTLQVRLTHPVNPVIPPPHDLNGQVVANTNPPPDNGVLLTWRYDADNRIVGFRVYRNSGSGFTMIAAEDKLTNFTLEYFDPSAPTCLTYYVVGVYLNTNGQWQESTPSNQWATSCP